MKQTFGRFVVDVPAGWDDESVIVLRAPVRKGPGGGLTRPTLVMKRVPMRDPSLGPVPTLEQLHEGEEAMLNTVLSHVTIHAQGELQAFGVRALTSEISFTGAQGNLRQLLISAVKDGSFLALAATCADDADFAAAKEEILAVVATASLTDG